METPPKIFGARATVYLRHDGDIHSLAKKLSKGLILPDFEISPSEWPPHEVMGSLEVLGWELWLEPQHEKISFTHVLKMETEHCVKESFAGDMHDLSPWLARFISEICGVESRAKDLRNEQPGQE